MGNNHTFLIENYYRYDGDNINMDYIVNTNYMVYTVDNINFRKGVRDMSFVIDKELYEYGFLDAEGTGWVNIYKLTY